MSDNSTSRKPSKPSKEELKNILTPEQFSCTQEDGTEAPFKNAYWDNHADGVYVDVVSGAPLFSSLDKFDSGSGWPSFTKPLDEAAILTKSDRSHGMLRTEVRSRAVDSHLGHVFDDGPGPEKKRYCINSASLKFIPVEKLEAAGLGRLLFQFAGRKGWEVATVAGGCFWGLEELLRKIPGVLAVRVGYTGGKSRNAKYEDVKTGTTGHAESVQILFDPARVHYEELLLKFFKFHDPTTPDRQGNDVGTQYRSAIFYSTETQKNIAEKTKSRVEKSGKWGRPVITQILPLGEFWLAEDYHQDYLQKNPGGYTCHFERKLDF